MVEQACCLDCRIWSFHWHDVCLVWPAGIDSRINDADPCRGRTSSCVNHDPSLRSQDSLYHTVPLPIPSNGGVVWRVLSLGGVRGGGDVVVMDCKVPVVLGWRVEFDCNPGLLRKG